MFELPDPPAEEVPPFEEVPPVDLEDLHAEGLEAFVAFDEAADRDGYDVLPVPLLEAAGWDALTDLEEALEAERRAGLDADGVLAEAAGTKRAERLVQAKQLRLAAHWADLHAVLTRPWMTTPGCERLVRLGGESTPEVAEFAPAEFGAVQQVSDGAAKSLIADALDLRHRLPQLDASVHAGDREVWIARKIAQQTRQLSLEAVARVDSRIAGLGVLSWGRLRKIIDAEILKADPPKAMDDAAQAAAEAGVFLDPEPTNGYQTMIINALAGDVTALNELIEDLSRALKILGDTRPPQQRRAAAAGLLANPQAALDLLAQAEHVRKTQREAAAARRAGDHQAAADIAATLPDGVEVDGRSGNQRPFTCKDAVVYYHLSREAIERILAGEPYAGAAVGRVEDLGPLILNQIREWLQHATVVVKPVVDLDDIPPVDHYETPDRISEAIGLIRSPDSWPHANSMSRHQDNEHTDPYLPMNKGGPPGQTDPKKMSKMTRGHHR